MGYGTSYLRNRTTGCGASRLRTGRRLAIGRDIGTGTYGMQYNWTVVKSGALCGAWESHAYQGSTVPERLRSCLAVGSYRRIPVKWRMQYIDNSGVKLSLYVSFHVALPEPDRVMIATVK